MRAYLTKPGNWPLQVKLTLGIIAGQMSLGAMLLIGVIHQSDRALSSHVKNSYAQIDTLLATTLIDPMLHRDFTVLQQLSDELLKNNLLEAVRISAPNGLVYGKSGDVDKLEKFGASDNIEDFDWSKVQKIHRVNKIMHGSQYLGEMRYVMSLREQTDARAKLVREFVLVASMISLIAILLSSYFAGRFVRRIKQIKRVSEAATAGDFGLRVVSSSEDELGKLAQGFNQLSASIHERMQALIQAEVLKSSYLLAAQNEKARMTALLDSMRFGVVFLNTERELVYSNKAVRRIWPEGLPDFRDVALDQGRERVLADERIIFENSHTVLGVSSNNDGAPSGEPNTIGSLWIFEDVTAERKTQKMIEFLAERDPLTGLHNRRSFTAAIQKAIEQNPDDTLALVYVDLDNFKLINDVKGHQQGDKVLIEIASKLSATTRECDVVGRIGGDEFVVLLSGIEPDDQAAWCDRFLLQLATVHLGDALSGSAVSCSMGLARYPRDANTPEQLLAAADEAMYDAKRTGKNAWRSFQKHSERDQEKLKKVLWIERINKAISNDGFEIFLQGVHYAQTRAIHHFEALVRMPDPENPGHYFNPREFIGDAEVSGKITQIDRWMIRHSLAMLANNPDCPPIAVNVSAVSLNDGKLVPFVKAQLEAHGVSGDRLHLELTETTALSDINGAQSAVAALQSLGCEVCLDDFGSGFASLAYLKLINANYLKVDGMFIQSLEEDRENQVLLRAIVDIAESSGRLTVAEWVEDEAMLETVKRYKIDLVQGYLLSRPRPAAQVLAQRMEVFSLS